MAKKKGKSSAQDTSATASAPKSARTGGRQAGDGRAAKGKDSAAASSPHTRVFTQDEIGTVAGEVWHVLSERGGQNLTALKKSVDAPGDLVLAAMGWLAREGKLDFDTSGRTVKISLR